MASGPSDRGNCGIKGFDFGSDDILCSTEDFINHGSSNGSQVDPSKDFHISRMTKASTYPATAYNSPESSLSQDVITTVEKSMKTYADNLMQFLEGMSTRLSQLELYCYNLDKSIGEMRSELTSDHEEADSKLKSVEKHLQEIHRSVQILRDKQELAETQKELAKLQLVRKESSSSSHLQSNEEKSLPSAMYQKRTDNNASDTHNQQLALALPHQVAFQQQHVAPLSQAPAPNVTQATQHPRYYMPTTPLPNLPSVAQLPQNQYLPSDPQYRNPQSTSSQVTGQSPPVQQFSQYQLPQPQPQQQQWPQQLPQQGQPQQQQQQQWPPKLPQQVQPPQPQQPADVVSHKAKTPTNNNSNSNKKETSNLLLGRYEIGKLLGHGTFAKVYYARNIKTGEGVAIKVIDKEKILKGGLVAHIKREISILRRVRHPNIVQLFEVMATKTKIYFVMEYVRGGELFNKVAKGRLKEEVARKYFQQLISAVGFCHARGVYHRDLKPENLLLDENGNLKVSDFGLSAVSDQIRQDGLFHTFCGTPAYVAPEVLARKGYDGAKVDLWSCGVVLFVLMAGYLPFHDQNVMAMYKKIYRGEFRCPRWFSPDLSKLLTRLLDTKPETRIAIPDIMENRWFKKGFKQIKFYVEDDRLCNVDDNLMDNDDDTASIASVASMQSFSDYSVSESDSEVETRRRNAPLPRPASLNAFDIISFSPGFDLSGLFEEKGDEARFVTAAPVSKIISKLEEIGQLVRFTVRKKDCRVSLEGTREGVKGPLTIAAEVFELTPSLVVVEVKKKGGDRAEYERFCNDELKPALQNLMDEESATPSALSTPTHEPSLLRVLSEPGHNIPLDIESPPTHLHLHEE